MLPGAPAAKIRNSPERSATAIRAPSALSNAPRLPSDARPRSQGLAGRGAELVAFVSANCRLCHELVPAFDALSRDGLPVRPVREDESPEVFDRWNVPGTPFVALVVDGVVRAKGLVNTLEQIDGLVETGRERARGGV